VLYVYMMKLRILVAQTEVVYARVGDSSLYSLNKFHCVKSRPGFYSVCVVVFLVVGFVVCSL
jgi:uncharacterized membrane protein